MKNFIPLILAVLLGIAAVLAVGRLLAARKQAAEKTMGVAAAARDIKEGEVITPDSIMEKTIPMSAAPAQHIVWSRAEIVVGQRALRSVQQNDYVLLSDVGLSRSIANVVGKGEWAVSMTVLQNGIARVVQPGDEVAILGTFSIKSRVRSADLSQGDMMVSREATLVLFPRVRVLDVGGLLSPQAGEGGMGEIIVALPPQQAQTLVSAQRKAQLTLALRSPHDDSAVNRLDAGMVDETTFDRLLDGLKAVEVPKIPDAREKEAGPQP